MKRGALTTALLDHSDPSVRWKVMVHVLGENQQSKKVKEIQEEIRNSPRIRTLLDHLDRHERLKTSVNVYGKWQGPHWVLARLADIGYPAGDQSLTPIRDQIVDCW